MNELEFAFIGTGNAWVAEGQCWNGFLVNDKYAICKLGRSDAWLPRPLALHTLTGTASAIIYE